MNEQRTRHQWPLLLASGLVLLALFWLLSGGAPFQEAGTRLVASGEHRTGNLATIRHAIRIEGTVAGDVTSWVGTITIAEKGHIGGDVVSYGGTIVLRGSAQVDGHVLALVGTIQQEPGTRIAGERLTPWPDAGLGASVTDFAGGPPASGADEPIGPILSTTLLLATMVIAAGSVAIWPHRTERISQTLQHLPAYSVALGVLTTLLLGALLLTFSALLALTLLGLPLVLGLLLLIHLPYIYGLVALANLCAHRLTRRPPGRARLWLVPASALALLVPLLLLGLASPLWSALLFYLLASSGLGALLLSRGGRPLVPRR